ncbi:MAG: type VI secretion system contractile sheath large subunit [Candidatus Cloacimonetes bacterium]|nr:type VI secretion system contractile sheath large subunit [Candidatus Cloacimonadota bacterium]
MEKEQEKKLQEEILEEKDQVDLLYDLVKEQESYKDKTEFTGLLQKVVSFVLDNKEEKISTRTIDNMIADLDEQLSGQVDAILHNETFQEIEAGWRSLRYLIDHTNFNENIKVRLLDISKENLLEDFKDTMDIENSGLYKHAYTDQYNTAGGIPFGMIVGNYYISNSSDDLSLLKNLASVATVAHAPFIGAVSSEFFGKSNMSELDKPKVIEDDLKDSNKYSAWRSFRETEDARNVGLVMPQFLLRTPYGPDSVKAKNFNYKEKAGDKHDDYLWGNAAFGFASCVTRSFAETRLGCNIIGEDSGGRVDDLPIYSYENMGIEQTRVPVEVQLDDRMEQVLSEAGFLPLVVKKGTSTATFYSSNSIQKVDENQVDKDLQTNQRLGAMLSYNFILSRFAHYLKTIQRSNLGSSKDRNALQDELNKWIIQYKSPESALPAIKAKQPLKEVSVTVTDSPGDPGWYKISLELTPHYKYQGADFTLSLVGKIEKNK